MMISNTCLLDIDDALSLVTKGETLECYKIPDDGCKVNTHCFVCNVINHAFVQYQVELADVGRISIPAVLGMQNTQQPQLNKCLYTCSVMTL